VLLRFEPFRDIQRASQGITGRPEVMPMDAYREGDHYVVQFDKPGVDPSSIDLTFEKNVVIVRAERNWKPFENQEVLVGERPQGAFSRQLFLGDSLDVNRIQATYEQGVLTRVIPVAEQSKPHKVAISVNGNERVPVGAAAGS
jgi:HSP20 family protein